MIETILNALSEKINGSSDFLSKPCGVARLQRERVEKKVKVYPVVPNLDPNTCNKQPYLAMVPSTDETAYCFFEVIDDLVNENEKKRFKAIATVRLVGWINTKRFENYKSSSIELSLMKYLSISNLELPSNITPTSLEILRIEPKNAQIFSKYTFDEVETQYLMHPFDYFSIQFKIIYTIAYGCVDIPILSQIISC
jgi:hypothetical protein